MEWVVRVEIECMVMICLVFDIMIWVMVLFLVV